MAHPCPRCGDPVQRGHSKGVQMAGGLVGALFYAAFGPLECKKCGKIPISEFPANVRGKIRSTSIVMVISAIALLVLVIWLLIKLQH